MEYEYTRVAPHNSFVADIEVTDVQSEIHITGRTQDLSLLGCGVKTSKPFPKGTRVRIKLSHGGPAVSAPAPGAYARTNLGLRTPFSPAVPKHQRTFRDHDSDI